MTIFETQINTAMTIRRMDLRDGDLESVARLAELDSARRLDGPVLGIEVEGRLLAAIEVESGTVIADPFSRTEELRSLLELRAAQLSGRGERRRRRAPRALGRRSRPALGGSPPGQIISLPRVN